MKRILFLSALVLAWVTSHALPFEPTSDPHSTTTKWYYLKITNYYINGSCIQQPGFPVYYRTSMGLAPSGTHASHWCFVSDGNGRYKVYNREQKRYLCDDGYLESGINDELAVYYRERTSDTFYLLRSYVDEDGATLTFNLCYDNEENNLLTEATTGNVLHGYFSSEYADQGSDGTNPDPDPTWTRYDANGVGYKFVDGGTSDVDNEGISNLCDDDASTKYYGTVNNCWIALQASQSVAVQQYSIVTANDSRGFYERSLKSWLLFGSNDNRNWFLIDTQNDYPMPFDDQVEVVIPVNDSREFTYFKFFCSEGATSTVQLSEVWINKEPHGSWNIVSTQDKGCGYPQVMKKQCSKCHACKTEFLEPTSGHNYVDGKCSVCGIYENETILLYNAQLLTPLYVKALHANRNGDSTWPSAPAGWNEVDFDDSNWTDLALPTASFGHTGGPFTSLQYNSHWYGEYNCYWMRRTFILDNVNAGDSFTLNCVHDDNMVVFVNGQQVLNAEGWTATPSNCAWDNSYESFSIPASAFREGENVLAIYIQQNWGGAYFDCELRVRKAGSITVAGDVNGDGNVTAADVTAIYNWILNNDDSSIVNGDQNGDGNITAADVTQVYNILLGSK